MKIIQTFHFQTEFFYKQISNKLSFIYKKIVRYALKEQGGGGDVRSLDSFWA